MIDLGVGWAHSPQDLAGLAELVITMLIDDQALDQVYFGPAGLLSGAVDKRLFIDMSTVKPAKQQEIGARLAAANASYLECPVGGSVGLALSTRGKEGLVI